MDRELLNITLDDLNYLSNEWNQTVDDSLLRITSPILRNLLVYDRLKETGALLRQRIRIMTPSIYKVLSDEYLEQHSFWQCGGAKHNGTIVMAMGKRNTYLTPEESKSKYALMKPVMGKNHPVKIDTYLKQTSFVVDGNKITRETVIKYVCNKLGGTHYNPSREHGSELLENQFKLLDQIKSGTVVADKNAIFYELLSIGQRIINSRDVRHLKKKIKNILNSPEIIHA